MMGQNEKEIFSIGELEVIASSKLPKQARDYLNGGAGDLVTVRDNTSSFDKFKIRPRILRDVSNVDTSTAFCGVKISLPIGLSPSAMHCMAHADGEKATSRAASSLKIPMGLSTYSTTSLEDVIAQAGPEKIPYAFQLSVVKDRNLTLEWISRAEKAGFKALFITVDAPVLGNRIDQKRNTFKLPGHLSLPHLPASANRTHHFSGRDASNSWETVIPWVKQNTKLQVWLKGIYSAEDVLCAIRYGIDGIIISNHGGRQLDGVPSTIDALSEIGPIAKGRIGISIDGGIRRGTDIFRALALGAEMCFLGRVAIWGLAYDGQAGVERAIHILESELRNTMALAGCSSLKDICRSHISVIGMNGLLCRL